MLAVLTAITLTGTLRHPPALERQVGVWVITFFDTADKFGHWAHVKKRHAAMPVRGPFSSSDPAEVARQYQQIRAAGVDYVLLDDTNTLHVDDDLIDKAVTAWFDYGDQQPPEKRLSLAIAAGGELNQHKSPKEWSSAVNELYRRFASRPSYLRADGRPVLYWYVEEDIQPDWSDPRWSVRKTFHFFRTADQFRNGGWGYGASDEARPRGLECASIQPGWDLSPPGFPRRDGDLYCERWVRALNSSPKSILLSDWNGWNEGTALSESLRWLDHYGDPTPTWYMDLTQGYVQFFKGRLLEGAYYRADGQPAVYLYTGGKFIHQSEYPSGKPVIVVPAGYHQGFPPQATTDIRG